MGIFTLDIGGAFIKSTCLPPNSRKESAYAAKGCRRRLQPQAQAPLRRDGPKFGITPFRLYENPKKLAATLRSLRPGIKIEEVGITMTGELCDCFGSRAAGVKHIVKAAESVFGDSVKIFARSGKFLRPGQAVRNWKDVASANWVITPLWLSRIAQNFLLVDIGSTTTDLTPVRKRAIANRGWTDFERSINGELLYTGCLRTPVAAVAQSVQLRGRTIPLAAETFSIMGDVHLIRGALKKTKYLSDTPDGCGKSRAASLTRLARQLMAEQGDLSEQKLIDIAGQLAKNQQMQIVKAAKVFRLPVISIGTGSFIIGETLQSGQLNQHELAGSSIVKNLGPSYSLAMLMREGRIRV